MGYFLDLRKKKELISYRKHGLSVVLREAPRKQKMLQMQNSKPELRVFTSTHYVKSKRIHDKISPL
jgi:hypothetical protein